MALGEEDMVVRVRTLWYLRVVDSVSLLFGLWTHCRPWSSLLSPAKVCHRISNLSWTPLLRLPAYLIPNGSHAKFGPLTNCAESPAFFIFCLSLMFSIQLRFYFWIWALGCGDIDRCPIGYADHLRVISTNRVETTRYLLIFNFIAVTFYQIILWIFYLFPISEFKNCG